ncbi:MAG TPA: hypothetical protein VF602_08890 [Pedobacter sp.]
MFNLSLKAITAVWLFLAFLPGVSAQTFDIPFTDDAYTKDAWLDLRYLNEGYAGENGFIRLSPDGRSFVNGKGEPQRFWAVNGAEVSRDFSDEQLASYARYLAKIGVNLIRYHTVIASEGKDSKIDEVDTIGVKNIWRAVAAFKKEGIYTAINPYYARYSPVPASWNLGEYNGDVKLWGVIFFNERLKSAYKKWVNYLYTTPSPYTGIPLKDEPAVALIQIHNEDGLLFATVDEILPNLKQEISGRFFQWAKTKYGSIDAAFNAWNNVSLDGDDKSSGKLGLYRNREATQSSTGGKAKRVSDQVQFYSEQQRDFYTEIRDHYKSMGCKQLINGGNWKPAGVKMVDADRWSNASVEVLAINRLYDPQHTGEHSGWRIDPGHKYVGASVLYHPELLPINVKQTAGKPFFVTMSAWNLPHKYQAEGPFLISSYLSLSGVDGLFWYGLTGAGFDKDPYISALKLENGQVPMKRWSNSVPGQMSMFPANALLYRKGYVAQGKPVVHEERTLPSIFKRDLPLILESTSVDPNHGGAAPIPTNEKTKVSPLAFLVGPVETVHEGDPKKSFVAPDLSELINLKEKVITSNTGQLHWNYNSGVCMLDAPKAKGVAGFLKKQPVVKLSGLTITSKNEYAVVQVVSMDDKTIEESEKILVQVGTVYRPTGWKEAPSKVKIDNIEYDGFLIENTGSMPWQGQEAHVSLSFEKLKVRSAHALDVNGYLTKEIQLNKSGKGWSMTFPKDALYVILNMTQPKVVR